jgi:eukaryotic-like serine/threonine-protein kinase
VTDRTPSLVGRERELSELRRGLDAALGGRGALFMVAGDAGVGKTALADAIGAEAAQRGACVLWGRTWDGGGAPAYWPWSRIVRRLAAARDIAPVLQSLGPEVAGRVTRLFPRLSGDAAAAAAGPAPDADESDAARFQLFDAVTSLLRAAALGGPLVLVLDDMHAADHPSLLLLRFLAGHLRDAPILVIATYREAEARQDPQLAATLGDIVRHGRRLPLRGLRESDVAEFVERVAGRRAPEEVVRAIHHATEGNPFFVDEVVRLLSAEGRLDDAAQVATVRIPDGVREAIRHRLEPLPDRTRIVLLTAAVFGRDFRLSTLQRVCDLGPGEVDAALVEALDANVIVEREGALDWYTFSHGLIRETLYEDLGPQRRGLLHRAVGRALEEIYASDPEPHVAELAHHFFVAATAGELEKAIEFSERAGHRALNLAAYEEAAGHFERALQVLGLQEQPDVARRCELLIALGTARSRAGATGPARETFMRAAALARRIPSASRLARAALGLGAGMGGFEFGHVDEVLVALLNEARDALGEQDDPLLARVLGRLATELYFSDRVRERAELGARAVEMARRTGDRATLASTLSARFITLWDPDSLPERLQLATDVVALGEDVRDRELVLRGHVWRIVSLMERGDWAGADVELSIHRRLAQELRDPLHLWYVPLFQASRALLRGHLDDAERLADEAYEVGRATQPQNAEQLHAVQLMALRAEQGRLHEVEGKLAAFARRYPAAPVWRAATTFAHAMLGRTDEARREFEALCADGMAAIPRDAEWLATIALLIRAGARLGDARRTGQLGALLEPYADRAVIAGRAAICLGPVARFAGIAAATAGRGAEAAGHLERSLEIARSWGAEPTVAAVRLELADVLERSGDESSRTAAARLRSEGLAVARRLRLAGLQESPAQPAHDGPEPAVAAGAFAGASAGAAAWAFYRRGDVWTIGPPGRQIQLRDAKGLAVVARLLAAPHVEIHALDLVAGQPAGGASPQLAANLEIRRPGAGDAGPVLDAQAKTEYRRRVEALKAEIDEADAFKDRKRAARARKELAFLERALAGAVGLGGRDRRILSDAERARINARRAISKALERIAEHDPQLGRRLQADIRTGTFCVYAPPPGAAPAWDLSGPR